MNDLSLFSAQKIQDTRPVCVGCGTPTGCEYILVTERGRIVLPCCFSKDKGCENTVRLTVE